MYFKNISTKSSTLIQPQTRIIQVSADNEHPNLKRLGAAYINKRYAREDLNPLLIQLGASSSTQIGSIDDDIEAIFLLESIVSKMGISQTFGFTSIAGFVMALKNKDLILDSNLILLIDRHLRDEDGVYFIYQIRNGLI